MLGALWSCGKQRGEREVWVRVGAWDARRRTQPLAVPDDAEAARAVVVPPGKRRRCPASRGVALIRVDRRREEDRELRGECDLAGEIMLEDVRLAGECRFAVLPERRVDVARGADPGVIG